MSNDIPSARSFLRERCALITPEGLVPSLLPGWEKADCSVAISPAMGARFVLNLAAVQPDGRCAGNTGAHSYFLYLLEGAASVFVEDRRHRFEPGSYAYLPPGKDMELNSTGRGTRVLVLQKPYQSLHATAKPPVLIAHGRDVRPQPAPGADGVRLQSLLPADPTYDFGVSLLSCNPGGILPGRHHMAEGGCYIMGGQGILRLNTEWSRVQAGDAFWAAPFCPRWFAAVGSAPCTLLAYEDANRDPI